MRIAVSILAALGLALAIGAGATVTLGMSRDAAPLRRLANTQSYPLHTDITATVFWIGEPVGNGSTENNAISAYDDRWLDHFGGLDPFSPERRAPWFPPFKPLENPFYLDLPYDDFLNSGNPRPGRMQVVPWASQAAAAVAAAAHAGRPYSLMKNRWVEIIHIRNGQRRACYGQVEDAGPYVYDDAAYVFGRNDQRPRNTLATDAGMDVSPALRDCLGFDGLNNDENKVDWRFVDAAQVPSGPWRRVVTTRQVFWP
ncbi:MAG TPA: hypothetical protein VKR23_07290 [Gaiellaceae bacterium]|nr:hypothetical protein [Gaiellaceae bacterium]